MMSIWNGQATRAASEVAKLKSPVERAGIRRPQGVAQLTTEFLRRGRKAAGVRKLNPQHYFGNLKSVGHLCRHHMLRCPKLCDLR